MDKLIDMHMHTNYSDGEFDPMDLIRKAINANVGVMAITDHDTLNGAKKVDRSASFIRASGIKVVNGIEITCQASKGTMHVLGYDIDLDNQDLNEKLMEIKADRVYATLSVMEQIRRDAGITFSYDDIAALINSNHIGRPNLARLCIKYGFCETVDEAFDWYLTPAKRKIQGLNHHISFPDCFKLIKDSGGLVVLAHPKTLHLEDDELDSLICQMKECGLDGIEIYNSIHSMDDVYRYDQLARKYDLLISGGTDYHGPTVKPLIEIGTGMNHNIKIKRLSLVDELKRRGTI